MLFKAMSFQPLSAIGPSMVTWALKLHLPIGPIIRKTIFSQFCGGESIDQALISAGHLARQNVRSILDFAVEGAQSEESFARTVAELENVIKISSSHAHVSFAVFKPTGITRFALLEKVSRGEALAKDEASEWELASQRFQNLCTLARKHNIRIMIDAEETWIQPAIDQMCETAMKIHNGNQAYVFTTVQLYRKDGLARLEQQYNAAKAGGYHFGVKLVRGAYLIKERERAKARGLDSPLHSTKKATDHEFDQALRFCVNHLDHMSICAGTHNDSSTLHLAKLMADRGVAKNDSRIEFAQLLGMSDNLTFNLAHHGYNVSKYVPYGPVEAVLPYLFRRAEENTAIRGQVSRELSLIESEIQRRRSN
jgi:proline dehydrogenase